MWKLKCKLCFSLWSDVWWLKGNKDQVAFSIVKYLFHQKPILIKAYKNSNFNIQINLVQVKKSWCRYKNSKIVLWKKIWIKCWKKIDRYSSSWRRFCHEKSSIPDLRLTVSSLIILKSFLKGVYLSRETLSPIMMSLCFARVTATLSRLASSRISNSCKSTRET